MKKFFLQIFFSLITLSLFASSYPKIKKPIHEEPLFQLCGGWVYSSIDLTRYNNSIIYKGTHVRMVTHIAGAFSLSTEYSTFPVHSSFPAWDDIHTRKIDINPQISFYTNNKQTRIFVFTGTDYHEWHARRTAFSDIDQLASQTSAGEYAEIKKWGANLGCGFTTRLYENISLFGDYRFCFSRSGEIEKVRIMDVMTTIGIALSIPYPERSNKSKSFGIGKKLYKWTGKG